MDKTPFSKKVEILNDFFLEYSDSDEYADFIEINDLGLPAAVLVSLGAITLTDKGIEYIENTWLDLCEMLEIDYHGEYENIYQLMEFANE